MLVVLLILPHQDHRTLRPLQDTQGTGNERRRPAVNTPTRPATPNTERTA
jgi:hypothetical protein